MTLLDVIEEIEATPKRDNYLLDGQTWDQFPEGA